ncbi:hypothetical protein N7523_005790 [Penicillium sp. IBT 18751x]|nr:hypothetical protein N7523_005790 [Penicillium sp. IBT 18751x]
MERIKVSQSPEFDASKTNPSGPWNEDAIEDAINAEHDDFDFDNELSDDHDNDSAAWVDDGPTSCRDIINECDYPDYYSD